MRIGTFLDVYVGPGFFFFHFRGRAKSATLFFTVMDPPPAPEIFREISDHNLSRLPFLRCPLLRLRAFQTFPPFLAGVASSITKLGVVRDEGPFFRLLMCSPVPFRFSPSRVSALKYRYAGKVSSRKAEGNTRRVGELPSHCCFSISSLIFSVVFLPHIPFFSKQFPL